MIIKDGVDYDKAPPVTSESDAFSMTASKDGVVFKMKEHYDNESDARAVTDKYLDEWKVLIGLRHRPDEINFKFDRSEIIDLELTFGSVVIHCPPGVVSFSASATFHVSKGKYPTPPSSFKISPNVETMYNRYQAYRAGQDHLLSMAYLVLTVLQMNQGRGRAANKYRISKNILTKLATLCGQGDHKDARKAPKSGGFTTPLSAQAKVWIEAVIPLIIKRVGLTEGGTQGLEQITMDSLPPLDRSGDGT
jgi:hypothetical protein